MKTKRYSTEQIIGILKKVLPPESRSVTAVSRETGINYQTINNWIKQYETGAIDDVSTKTNSDSYAQYLFPGDEDFERVLQENLCRKYEALHGRPYAADNAAFRFTLDQDYADRKNGKIQKLITIKEGWPDETRVKGLLAPFCLEAPAELMGVGYECGFGERNSQGFGMVKPDVKIVGGSQ